VTFWWVDCRREYLHWCGPRQLLLGSAFLIDLDLGLTVVAGRYRAFDSAVLAQTSPDGRLWYLRFCKPAYQPDRIKAVLPALQESRHLAAVEKTGLVLAACSVPAEIKNRIDAHCSAATLSKMTVRVDVAADESGFRRQAGEALADALASIGCRVAPSATSVARLVISPAKSDLVEKLSSGTPGFKTYELVPGKILEAKLEILDQQGGVHWSVSFNESEPDATADALGVVRKKLITRLGRILAGRSSETLPPLDHPTNVGIDGISLPAMP
jgi:hypothetical protein